MRAVTFQGPKDIRVVEKERPTLVESTDAIMRVTTSAICGTDLHLFHDKFPGVSPGTTVGHEFVGIVEEVGSSVRDVTVGTRYVASMFPACGTCPACSRDDWRNCGHWGMFGLGDVFGSLDGGQADYVRIPFADMTLSEVPERLTDEDVIFVGDILSTAFAAMVQAPVRPGDVVAIVGAGPVGQLATMCAPLFGASWVFVVDPHAARRKEAEALGAIAINPDEQDPLDVIAETSGTNGADVVIEAVGIESSLEVAWGCGRVGSTIAIVGALLDEAWPLTCGDNWIRATIVKPILGNPITHRHQLLRLIESGRIEPGRIVSHTMSLDDATEAYRMFDEREAMKIVLKP